jgi:hypothetical protein
VCGVGPNVKVVYILIYSALRPRICGHPHTPRRQQLSNVARKAQFDSHEEHATCSAQVASRAAPPRRKLVLAPCRATFPAQACHAAASMRRCTTALLQLSWQLSGGCAPQAELTGHTLRRPAAQAPCLDCLPSRRRRGIAALQLQVRAGGSPRACVRIVPNTVVDCGGVGWAFKASQLPCRHLPPNGRIFRPPERGGNAKTTSGRGGSGHH